MNRPRPLVDRRLLGNWQSDRRLTFKHFTPARKQTPAQLRKFKTFFGKLVVRWTPKYLHTELNGFRERARYDTISRDSRSVVIKSYNCLFEEDLVEQIFFDDQHYWFWTPWGMREFFKRIP